MSLSELGVDFLLMTQRFCKIKIINIIFCTSFILFRFSCIIVYLMDSLYLFLIAHLTHLPWVVFGLFMLAGMHLPISEDLLIVTSGILASTIASPCLLGLFCAVILGAFFSDWIPYWVGRKLGPKLLTLPLFSRLLKQERIDSAKAYFEKYGLWTIFFGRFIPFGGRGCLFLTAGFSKMDFRKVIFADGLACLIGVTTLFSAGYFFGKNCSSLFSNLFRVELVLLFSFLFIVISFICYKVWKSKRKPKKSEL